METTDHETWCGLMSCPHPSCWNAQRRTIRGIHRNAHTEPTIQGESSALYYGLPTQKVHNVTDSVFGSACTGLEFSSGPSGMDIIEYHRARKKQFKKSHSSAGFRGGKHHRTESQMKKKKQGVSDQPVRAQTLEVREVFELTDLHDDLQDTCNTRPFYVWVPNLYKASPSEKANGDIRRTTQQDEAPKFQLAPVHSRDVTQAMINQSTEREISPRVQHVHSPVALNRPSRFFGATKSGGGPGLPLSQSLQQSVASLENLPAGVLSQFLDNLEQGELISETSLKKLLEQSTKEGAKPVQSDFVRDVLHQRKLKLHSSRERTNRQPEVTANQVYRLDPSVHADEVVEGTEREQHDEGDISRLGIPPLPPIHPSHRGARDRSAPGSVRSIQFLAGPQPVWPASRPRAYQRVPHHLDLMLGPVASPTASFRSSPTSARTDNDTASINVTVSSNRSTLYHEILPGIQQPTLINKGSRNTTESSNMNCNVQPESTVEVPQGAKAPLSTPHDGIRGPESLSDKTEDLKQVQEERASTTPAGFFITEGEKDLTAGENNEGGDTQEKTAPPQTSNDDGSEEVWPSVNLLEVTPGTLPRRSLDLTINIPQTSRQVCSAPSTRTDPILETDRLPHPPPPSPIAHTQEPAENPLQEHPNDSEKGVDSSRVGTENPPVNVEM